MGYRFIVSNQTLIPRPCTETLVELTEDFLVLPHNFTQEIDSEIVAIGRILKPATGVINIVADIGTGSGCIALSLALRQPILTVIATDVSETALEVAASNALLHNLKRVTFNCSSLLEALNNIKEPFIVVSNPPYIPSTITLDASVANFEPHKALFAEHDGLGVIRPLIEQMIEHPYCIGFCMECRADQVYAIDDMLR
jgi:release factor glutamine methyltransferase